MVIDHRRLPGLEALDDLAEAIIGGARRHRLVAEHQAGPEVDAGDRLLAVETDAAVLVHQRAPKASIMLMTMFCPPGPPRRPKP